MFCNVTRAMLSWLMLGIASVAVSGHRTVVTFENDDVFNSLTPNGFGLHAEGTVNITIKVYPSTPAGSDGHRAYSRNSPDASQATPADAKFFVVMYNDVQKDMQDQLERLASRRTHELAPLIALVV